MKQKWYYDENGDARILSWFNDPINWLLISIIFLVFIIMASKLTINYKDKQIVNCDIEKGVLEAELDNLR